MDPMPLKASRKSLTMLSEVNRYRYRGKTPSTMEPLAFLRSISGGIEFPLTFEPDDLYFKSKEDDVAVDRFVHWCNVLKSLMCVWMCRPIERCMLNIIRPMAMFWPSPCFPKVYVYCISLPFVFPFELHIL